MVIEQMIGIGAMFKFFYTSTNGSFVSTVSYTLDQLATWSSVEMLFLYQMLTRWQVLNEGSSTRWTSNFSRVAPACMQGIL